MSDNASAAGDSPDAQTTKAPKDRNCPYCGQAFTSSSLGRHLDLYIKEKNPKPPDGIHDVDAIRKMRGSITRRQPRGSLARRDTSTPGTPSAVSTKSPGPEQSLRAPAIPKDGQFVVDQSPSFLFQPSWEATGVMNDIPSRPGELKGPADDNWSQEQARRPSMQQRAPSRMAQKAGLDARHKLIDAIDTAKAAELALREILSSFRAAKQQINMNSLPFEYDPLALDFPALTLQCLQPPPTLFSSTPHPTSTSWSIQPPGQKQYEALKSYFQEEFRKWKVACALATTAALEDLTYPPSNTLILQDARENVKKAEKAAAALERQVNEHLQSTFQVWEALAAQRRTELWTLELARSVGRRQKDIEKLQQSQHALKQENTNLQQQIEQLNRLQQPREFRIMQPATIPFEESFVSYLLELGGKGQTGIGFNVDDRHIDMSELVTGAIDRWKKVIVSSRAGSGLNAQKSLDQAPTPTPATPSTTTSTQAPRFPVQKPTAQSQVQTQQQQQQQQPQQQQPQMAQPRNLTVSTSGPAMESSAASTTAGTTTSASVANDESSDQDADAEMDEDDSFATMATPIMTKPTQPDLQQLQVPRTRGNNQRMPSNANEAQYAINGAVNVTGNNRAMNMARSMPNMNSAMQGHGQHGHAVMTNGDFGVVQGVGAGDPMYMD